MKGFIKIGVAFIAGLAVGAVAFKKYVETKYDFIDDIEEDKTETPQIEEERAEDPVEEQQETVEEFEDISDRYEEILSEMMYKHEKECEECEDVYPISEQKYDKFNQEYLCLCCYEDRCPEEEEEE